MKKQNLLIKTNNLFQLGGHKLLCGDATNAELVQKLVSGNKIKMILTDPPYGVNYVESSAGFKNIKFKKRIVNDHLQCEGEYSRFTKDWLMAVKPFMSSKNAVYIFNSDKMLFALNEGMKEAGCKFAQLLIWIKNHAVIGRLNYLVQHELIAYGWFGKHEFMKSPDKSVLFYPRPQESNLHPTMKPVGLLRRLILNSTKIGYIIYDPFSGSGSTLMACEQTKRRCLMVEIDPEYCQTIIKRWEKLTGEKSKKLKE